MRLTPPAIRGSRHLPRQLCRGQPPRGRQRARHARRRHHRRQGLRRRQEDAALRRQGPQLGRLRHHGRRDRRHRLCHDRRAHPQLPQRHRRQHVPGRRQVGVHQRGGRGPRQVRRVPCCGGRQQRRRLVVLLAGQRAHRLHRRRHRRHRHAGVVLQLRELGRHLCPGCRYPLYLDRWCQRDCEFPFVYNESQS